MANDPGLPSPKDQARLADFGVQNTLTNGRSFQDGSTFGSKYDEGLKSSLLKKETPKAADPRNYTVKPLTEDEWKSLSASQQRAVAGNQLMYQASLDANSRGAIHSFLGYNTENPAPAVTNFATMEDIRHFDGNAPDESETVGWGVRIRPEDYPKDKPKTNMWGAEIAPDVISPTQLDTLTNLANLVNQYGKTAPGQRMGRLEKLDVDSILTNGASSVGQYVGRKKLSIADESQKLDPLIKSIATVDWGQATPDDVKSLEAEIRSTTQDMPLEQALAYMRKQFTRFGEQDENFDSEAIIRFLNIGGSNGG